MARLAPLAAVVLVMAACVERNDAPARISRSESVRPATPAAPEDWCDVKFTAGAEPLLTLPPVAPARPGGQVPKVPSGRWIWLNVWATWCEPCRREMPLLLTWRDSLRRAGVGVDVWFLSLDDDAAELARYLREHPAVAPEPSLRVQGEREFGGWIERLLKETPGIPIHLLAAPDGRVRCARTGPLRDGDYPAVKRLFGK